MNYGNNRPEMIECTHEEIAVAMAHGYAKATGRPMAAIVHNVVGLLHSAMAVYYSYLDRVPVLVLGARTPPIRRNVSTMASEYTCRVGSNPSLSISASSKLS